MPGVKVQNWRGWKIVAVDKVGNTIYEIGFDFAPPETRPNSLAQLTRG
jgi:hypothetical protein